MDLSRRGIVKTGLCAAAASCAECRLHAKSRSALALAFADDTVPLHDRVFNEADRVFKNTQHTKYQHKQFIDEATGTYYVDCSGFVGYVLTRMAKRHLALIPKEGFWPVPRAFKYYEYFAGLTTTATHGWRKLDRLDEARPGDIIAWQLSDDIRKDHDTGHVFIVAETLTSVGDQLFAVRAFDSAALRHYDDTRVNSDGVYHDGVGEGTFHLRVDADGKPTAFQFGPGDKFHEHPISIGHILPL